MAVFRGASIVSNGLTLYYDGGNPASLPTTSSTWFDLSGYQNNISLTSTTYNSDNGGNVLFAGTSLSAGTITENDTYRPTGSNMTIEAWVKFNYLDYTTSSGSLIFITQIGNDDQTAANTGLWLAYDNRANATTFLYTCFGNSAGGFSGGNNHFGNSAYNTTFTTGSWNQIAAVITNSTGSLYINGIQKGPSKIFTGLSLYSNAYENTIIGGTLAGAPVASPYNLGNLKLYKRALSSTEILQNYDAFKTRYNR